MAQLFENYLELGELLCGLWTCTYAPNCKVQCFF